MPGGYAIRRNIKHMNDISHNFGVISHLLMGHLDSGNINDDAIDTLHLKDLAVTNAKIESLVADKIDAGTITAEIEIISPVITGGLFRTNIEGSRAVMADDVFTPEGSGAGFLVFDSTGTRRLEISTNTIDTSWYDGMAIEYTYGSGTQAHVGNAMEFGLNVSIFNISAHGEGMGSSALHLYSDKGPLEIAAFSGGTLDPNVSIQADNDITLDAFNLITLDSAVKVTSHLAVDTITANTSGIVDVTSTLRAGNGASGTFTTSDGKTVTVSYGIISGITE